MVEHLEQQQQHSKDNLARFFLEVNPFDLRPSDKQILHILGIDPALDPYTLTRELLLAEEKFRGPSKDHL